MKDDHLMKTVSKMDGSRFASTPDSPAGGIPGLASSPSARTVASRFAIVGPEESLVVDDRANLSPAQVVESKLIHRLKESSLPVSHLQMRGLVRARFEA